MAEFLNGWLTVVSVVLLAMVAGLLLVVGIWLRELRSNAKKYPILAEDLTRQLINARALLDNIRKSIEDNGPQLNTHMEDASRLRQDLQFLTAKGEQVAVRLEQGLGRVSSFNPPRPSGPEVAPATAGVVVLQGDMEATVESGASLTVVGLERAEVAAANGVAQASTRDPLEELLAGLAADQPTKPKDADAEGMVRRRAGVPVSQAELDLRRKLVG